MAGDQQPELQGHGHQPTADFRRLIESEGEPFSAGQPLCGAAPDPVPGPGPFLMATGSHNAACPASCVVSLKVLRFSGVERNRMERSEGDNENKKEARNKDRRKRNPAWKTFIVNSSRYYLAGRCRRVEIFMHCQSCGPAVINITEPPGS